MRNIKDTLIYRWFEEVWNKGNEAVIEEMFHPDITVYGLGPGEVKGVAGFMPFFHTFRNDLANIHLEVEDVIIEGDKQVARCTVTGKHSTGRNVHFTGVCICRFQDNKIIESWNNYDFLTMTQQLTAEEAR